METSAFSNSEKLSIAIAPKVTAAISTAALIYGIHHIVSSPSRRKVLMNRLFLVLFIHELIRSLTFVLGTWLIPKNLEQHEQLEQLEESRFADSVWASGTKGTCALQSFMSQLGQVSTPLYVLSIMVYCKTAICNEFNIARIRWVEKWCHFVPNFLSLVLAVLLIALRLYGIDDGRCWITPTHAKCINKMFFEQHQSKCSPNLIHDNVTYELHTLSFSLLEHGIPILSYIVTIILFVITLIAELQKRRSKIHYRGKRKYIESARKQKSLFILKQSGVLGLCLICSFGLVTISRLTCCSFMLILPSILLNTFFGSVAVIIYLYFKLPRNEIVESQRTTFSLRNSVLNKNVLPSLTHGYSPTVIQRPIDDGKFGGIYLGDDDDDSDDSDEYEFDVFEISDNINKTTTTTNDDATRSVDTSNHLLRLTSVCSVTTGQVSSSRSKPDDNVVV